MGREQGLNIPKTNPSTKEASHRSAAEARRLLGNIEGTLSVKPELACHEQITYGSLVAMSLEPYLLGRRCGLCRVSSSRMPAFGASGGCEIVSAQFT